MALTRVTLLHRSIETPEILSGRQNLVSPLIDRLSDFSIECFQDWNAGFAFDDDP